MSGIITVSAASVALYYLLKQRTAACGVAGQGDAILVPPVAAEACRNVEHPPNTWLEALYYFKEVFRYMYSETFGRWHTVDLFIGLAYLSHRQLPAYAAQDIAERGRPISLNLMPAESKALMEELHEIRRYMLYCRGLKHRRPDMQVKFWMDNLGLESGQLLCQQSTAGLLRPAYVLVRDDTLKAVVLCIRGTQSMKDLFTSLAGATKPHHLVHQNGVVLGYSHLGMLAAARWIYRQAGPALKAAVKENEGYALRIVGHSMGGGAAVMLTMMLRELVPECADARCYAIACPACMTLELAASCTDYVTSIVNGTDIVPTFCSAAVDALREDVMASSWFAEFQRDLRGTMIRALQGGIRGVGTATQATRSIFQQAAALPFRACIGPRAGSSGGGAGNGLWEYSGIGSPEQHGHGDSASGGAGHREGEQEQEVDRGLREPLLAEGGDGAAESATDASYAGSTHQSGLSSMLSLNQWRLSIRRPSAAPAAATHGAGGSSGDAAGGAGQQQQQPAPPGSPLSEAVIAEALHSCLYAVESAVGPGGGSTSGAAGAAPSGSSRAAAAGDMLQQFEDSAAMEQAMRMLSGAAASSSGRGEGAATADGPHSPIRSAPSPVRGNSSSFGMDAMFGGGDLIAFPTGLRNRSGSPADVGSPMARGGSSAFGAAATKLGKRLWPWAAAAPAAESSPGRDAALPRYSSSPRAAGSGGDAAAGGSGRLGIGAALGGWWRSAAGAGTPSRFQQQHGGAAGSEPPSPSGSVHGDESLSPSGDHRAPTNINSSSVAQQATSWLGSMFAVCTAPRQHAGGPQTKASSGAQQAAADSHQADDQHLQPGHQLHEFTGSSDEEVDEDTDLVGMGHASMGEAGGPAAGVAAAAGSAAARQQLQAGITAVVAAVTHEPGSARQQQEQAAEAESVLREAEAGAGATAAAAGRRPAAAAAAGAAGDEELAFSRSPGAPDAPQQQHFDARSGEAGPAAAEEPASAQDQQRSAVGPSGRQQRQGNVVVKRPLYPAGRILHLFPAEVLQPGQQQRGAAGTAGQAAAAAAAAAGTAAAAADAFQPPMREDEEADGDASASAAAAMEGSAAAAAAAAATAAAHQQPQQQWVLYEVPDHKAYGRVKLCKTMVMDHFVFGYLQALDSVMAQLEAQAAETAEGQEGQLQQ